MSLYNRAPTTDDLLFTFFGPAQQDDQVPIGDVLGLTSAAVFGYTNVKSYGATGNGTTDDTAAIQSAWSALCAVGGGVLYSPRGNYLTTGVVLQGCSNFVIKGDRGANIWITLYDDRGGSAQQNFGLQELGATASSQIAYNRVYGNTSGQISAAGTSTQTGNIIS